MVPRRARGCVRNWRLSRASGDSRQRDRLLGHPKRVNIPGPRTPIPDRCDRQVRGGDEVHPLLLRATDPVAKLVRVRGRPGVVRPGSRLTQPGFGGRLKIAWRLSHAVPRV